MRQNLSDPSDRSRNLRPALHLAPPLIAALILAVPAILVDRGIVARPPGGLTPEGNALYAGVSAAAVLLLAWRGSYMHRKKPLPGLLTRQGLIIIGIGLSGLLLLAAFAPRFPESARAVYLAAVGIVIGFAVLPLGLLAYLRRKLPTFIDKDNQEPPDS